MCTITDVMSTDVRRDDLGNPIATVTTGDLEVSVCKSQIDGVPYVMIDTQKPGAIRVDLNDGSLWDGDPEVYDLAALLERVEVVWSEAHDDRALMCSECKTILCTIESGDTMNVLAATAKDHVCEPVAEAGDEASVAALPATVAQFAAMLDDEMMIDQMATGYTCVEIETLAGFLRACGKDDAAATWLHWHAQGDDEGDEHRAADYPLPGELPK